MDETFVRLLCPACDKNWQSTPSTLPSPTTDFACPDCDEQRPLSVFTRTEQDLQTLKLF